MNRLVLVRHATEQAALDGHFDAAGAVCAGIAAELAVLHVGNGKPEYSGVWELLTGSHLRHAGHASTSKVDGELDRLTYHGQSGSPSWLRPGEQLTLESQSASPSASQLSIDMSLP